MNEVFFPVDFIRDLSKCPRIGDSGYDPRIAMGSKTAMWPGGRTGITTREMQRPPSRQMLGGHRARWPDGDGARTGSQEFQWSCD